MRSRTYRRNPNSRRKTVGAVIVAGVLVATGITGVQLASAGTEAKAADLVSVDGQQFDVSQCTELQVNAGSVVCDGEELAPVEAQAPGDAAADAAVALEAACDQFAADVAAAGGDDAGQEAEEAAEDPAAAKAENKAQAKKWAKVLRKAAAAAGKGTAEKGAAGKGAAGKGAAEEGAAEEGAAE